MFIKKPASFPKIYKTPYQYGRSYYRGSNFHRPVNGIPKTGMRPVLAVIRIAPKV